MKDRGVEEGRGEAVDLSVIVPLLNEEGNLRELYERLSRTLGTWGRTYELLFVDDGSTDSTPALLEEIASSDEKVRVVRLSRNLGQHHAILMGFDQSQGEVIVTIDGDLQNHPEDIPKLVKRIEDGYDVAAGWRRRREDRFYRRLISRALSWFASTLTGVRLRDYGCMLRAYRRWVFERVRVEGGDQVFIPTVVARLRARVAEVEVAHSLRLKGRSKYGPARLLRLYLDLLSGLSLFSPGLTPAFRKPLSLAGVGENSKSQGPHRVREVKGGDRPWKVCVFAYGEIGYVCLDELIRLGERVVALVTHPDDPGEQIWFRSVRELARGNLVPVHEPANVNDSDFIKVLRDIDPHLIVSFSYRQILSKEILDIPSQGAFNLHPSLLPRYRGRCPANWVLVKGETKTGVTLHHMEERVDSGDIVGQVEVAIAPEETIRTLYPKLCKASVQLLRETLPKLKAGSVERIPQNEAEASYFGRRTPEDGKIDWGRSADEIHNLVRAVTHPYPGAFSYWQGKKVFCWRARVSEGEVGQPGEVLRVGRGKGILVSCSSGALLLESIQVEGGEEGQAWEMARRLGIRRGVVLGSLS